MGLSNLNAEEYQQVNVLRERLNKGSIKALDLVQELGPDLSNLDLVEKGLTKLVLVLKGVPSDLLTENDAHSLVQFFLGRLEASALRTGCAVVGLHDLVLKFKLPERCLTSLFETLFDKNTIPSFPKADRSMLFDIFEFFVTNHLSAIQPLGVAVVYDFTLAASHERDPECLVQVFRIYRLIVQHFDLGIYCEEFFELVAGYFPIEYTPADSTAHVTREMLVTGLSSCLLSHRSFGFYCFQMISDTVVDDDLSDDIRIEVFDFLARAARIFDAKQMKIFIDNYLVAARRLCLNPANRSKVKVPEAVKNGLTGIIDAFKDNDDELTFIANSTAENCEPFVRQAEMGLTAKALDLLFVVARAHQKTAEVILPQTMLWIGSLITAETVNAPQNRKEIVTDAIAHVPDWFRITAACGCHQFILDAIPGFVEGLGLAEETYGSWEVKAAQYQTARFFLEYGLDKLEGISVQEFLEKLVRRAVTDLIVPNAGLRQSIAEFASEFSNKHLDNFARIVESILEGRELDSALACLIIFGIVDERSCERLSTHLWRWVASSGVPETVRQPLVDAARKLASSSTYAVTFGQNLISAAISGVDESSDTDAEHLAAFLQDLVFNMDAASAEKLARWTVDIWDQTASERLPKVIKASYLVSLQSSDVRLLDTVIPRLEPGDRQYAQFVRHVRQPASSTPPLLAAKAAFLLNTPGAIDDVTKVVLSALEKGENLASLLDTVSPGFDPIKNRLPVSPLWRQRIVVQFVGIFVTAFEHATTPAAKEVFLSLLGPLLENSARLPFPPTNELLRILPILVEALQSLVTFETVAAEVLEVLLAAMADLLRQAAFSDMPGASIGVVLECVKAVLARKDNSIKTTLSALDIVHIIATHALPEVLAMHHAGIVSSLRVTALSPKRIIRLHTAAARNQWEIALA